jgi:hypothetical protein
MAERCCFRPSFEPTTLEPRGPQCPNLATHQIQWKDGRISYACKSHGTKILEPEAKELLQSVKPLRSRRNGS